MRSSKHRARALGRFRTRRTSRIVGRDAAASTPAPRGRRTGLWTWNRLIGTRSRTSSRPCSFGYARRGPVLELREASRWRLSKEAVRGRRRLSHLPRGPRLDTSGRSGVRVLFLGSGPSNGPRGVRTDVGPRDLLRGTPSGDPIGSSSAGSKPCSHAQGARPPELRDGVVRRTRRTPRSSRALPPRALSRPSRRRWVNQ